MSSVNLKIPSVVGRRSSGRRGGGHRRASGGYGVYYAYPWCATEEIVELSPGVPVRVTTEPRAVTLLSGLASGRRDRELADLGTILAPGSGGITVQLDMGPDRRLHASLCIDGECYRGSVDLSAVLDHLARGIASHHATLHAEPPDDFRDEPEAGEGAADAAVEAAGDLLVGALLDQHSVTLSAGWWHSVTNAFSDVHHAVSKTVKTLKGPITLAATAVATVYGGPAGGAAAAQLTGPIIDAVTDNKASGAKAVVEAAHAAAQADPRVAKALGDAHKAVADTAAAYHLTTTAADAAGGDPAAARKLADLDQAAASGDAAAQRALSIITQAFSAAADNASGPPTMSGAALVPFALGTAAGIGAYGAYDWWRRRHRGTGAKPGADAGNRPEATLLVQPPDASMPELAIAGDPVHAPIMAVRRAAQNAVRAVHERTGATALGYVQDAHTASVWSFPTLDDADDWFGRLDQQHYLYAAYFDAGDPTWPSPIHEWLSSSAMMPGVEQARAPMAGHNAHVGASILQTPGSARAEIDRIHYDFLVLSGDFLRYLDNRQNASNVDASLQQLVELFHGTWVPLLDQWMQFHGMHRGWWDNFWWNHAPQAERLHAQLVQVRTRAKQLGMPLSPPKPTLSTGVHASGGWL